jgi:trk system potassium uptake protein
MLLLWIAGMELFDAVCHSFTTMSSGGFSTKQASIAHWPSPAIHYIIIVFMFLAGTNFTLSYLAIKGKFKPGYQG